MSRLIGSETDGTSTSPFELTSELAEAFQFEATATGTVERIAFHTASTANSATAIRVAIVPDVAGTPGSVVLGDEAENPTKPANNALFEVSGLSASVTKGSLYWLILLPL